MHVGLFRKKKKENTEDVSGISSQDITIKIFRDLGSNVNTCVGEFNALEKRDSFGGMVIENAKINFLEDVDFEKEEIFDELNILLRIRNKNKKESLDILSKKIVEQKKKIKYLEKFVELNAVFNYPDEQLLLRHLTVLYNHIQNIPNERGSFFTFEKGRRVYSFVKQNGQYHPIWHNVANYTTYPDYTRKHKIANLETEIFKTEFGEFLRKYAAHGSLAMMAIILCILILGVGWAGLQVMDKSKALDVAAQKSSLECVNQYNEINKQIGQLIENEVLGPLIKLSANETLEDKKNEINLKTITDLVK
jgi:hypothetical protein